MSDLENLQQENESLKKQLITTSQNFHGLSMQLEAHKGELADARVISMQLRVNLGSAQNVNVGLTQQVKNLQAQLEEMKNSKTAEVPPDELKSKKSKS